jgi:hypothetical protein
MDKFNIIIGFLETNLLIEEREDPKLVNYIWLREYICFYIETKYIIFE